MRQGHAPFLLDPRRHGFPDPRLALDDPNGLLAIGGDLSSRRLLDAYRMGIFPWYSEDQPLLWWTPDPRAVLLPKAIKVTRSLHKTLRRRPFRIAFDTAFEAVLDACAAPRRDGPGTWITPAMRAAFLRLHQLGYAHSVEAWSGDTLAGGLYGLALGRVFFGESMFSRQSDASKVAFVHLARQLDAHGFGLIDCQVASRHLTSLGATDIPRGEFMAMLDEYCPQPSLPGPWHLDTAIAEAVAR